MSARREIRSDAARPHEAAAPSASKSIRTRRSLSLRSQLRRVSAMRSRGSRIGGGAIECLREVTDAVTAADCLRRSALVRSDASLFPEWRARSCRPPPVSRSKVSHRTSEFPSHGLRFVLVFFVLSQLLGAGFCRRADFALGARTVKHQAHMILNREPREPNGALQPHPAMVSSCMLCCALGILPVGPVAVTARADRVVPAWVGQSPPPPAERDRLDRPPKAA